VKQTYYTQPRVGGTFKMTSCLLAKYPFLVQFAATKPMAALLCQKLTRDLRLSITSISPVAISHELENISKTRFYFFGIQETMNESQKKLKFFEYYSTHFLNYTLVMHPVGRHYDVFANNLPSLENRVCFSFPQVNGTSGVSNTGLQYGRGGCGINNFCFAILDWRSKSIQ